MVARTNTLVILTAPADRSVKFFRMMVSDVDTDGDGLNDWEEYQLGLDPLDAYSNGHMDGQGRRLNDYEYIMFEDMKAAGFEPMEVRSGYNRNDLRAYMELRDDRVCFFSRVLPRGQHSVAYRMRAEIPGRFSALPTRVSAMYAPELKANSDEMKIGVTD